MKRYQSITAAALTAALLITPLAGCGESGQQGDAKQQEAAEQKRADIDYMVLVNKQNKLPDGWEEALDLTEEKSLLYDDPVQVEKNAYEAYKQLQEDLAKDGVTVELDSCYRSVAHQQEVWDEFLADKGEEYTKTHVATPGYSEHHTGLALDLFLVVDGEQVFENDEMMKYPEIWEKVHAKLADYGFILRYLDGKDDITGYSYEPWHIRYIGDTKVAHEIMDNGLTFEEYLGVADEAKAANAKAKAEEEAAASQAADYEVDYGTSKLYTNDDIDAAVEVVMAQFGGWKGCTMKKIAFTDDDTCKDNLEYANSMREDGTPEFDEALVLISEFHSPSEEEAEGTAWEPDTDYKDYSWTLGRTKGGEWVLIGWGWG